MTCVERSAPVVPISHPFFECAKPKFPLFSKFNISWEKGILTSNIILLITGIAYGFFMRLPFIMISLSLYGLFYLGIYTKVKNARPSTGKLYALRGRLKAKEEQNKKLSKKLEDNLHGKDLAEDLHREAGEKQTHLEKLHRINERLLSEVEGLREKQAQLEKRRRR